MNEFLQKVEQYGIPYERLRLHIGKDHAEPSSIYIIQDGEDSEEWKIVQTDELSHEDLWSSGDEEECFEEFYELLFYQMRQRGYINQYITEKVIETSRKEVNDFLEKEFGYDYILSWNTWMLLIQDFAVLNELKYFVRTGKFVPNEGCIKREGYSAEMIAKKKRCNAAEAFEKLAKIMLDHDMTGL